MLCVHWLKLHHFVYVLVDTCMHSQLIHLYNLQILAAKLGWPIIIWVITFYALVRPKFPFLFTIPFSYACVLVPSLSLCSHLVLILTVMTRLIQGVDLLWNQVELVLSMATVAVVTVTVVATAA